MRPQLLRVLSALVVLSTGRALYAAPLDDDLAACAGEAQRVLRTLAVANATALVDGVRGRIADNALRALVLEVRADGDMLELMLGLALGELAVGQEGAIGGRKVTVTEAFGAYARARAEVGSAVAIGAIATFALPGPWVEPVDPVAAHIAAYAVRPDEAGTLIAGINDQGGIPFIDFNAKRKLARVPAEPEPESGVWNPKVLPDGFLRGVATRVVDLEQNGSRYALFGILAGPVNETTVIYTRGKGSRWSQVFAGAGVLKDIRPGPILVFEDSLSVSRVAFDLASRRFTPTCSVALGMAGMGGDDRLSWATVAAAPRAVVIRKGPAKLAFTANAGDEVGDKKVARGARGWVLATRGDRAMVALILPTPGGVAGRSLDLGWLPAAELEDR